MNKTIRVGEDTRAALEGCKEGAEPFGDLLARIIAGLGFGPDSLTVLPGADFV